MSQYKIEIEIYEGQGEQLQKEGEKSPVPILKKSQEEPASSDAAVFGI